jgi:hypothetical protein
LINTKENQTANRIKETQTKISIEEVGVVVF